MAETSDIQDLRDQLRGDIRDLGTGISEIRSTLSAFIERLTRLEERSERIPALEHRIDEVDKKLEPIRDDVIAATTTARWANKIAKIVMPGIFAVAALFAGLYVNDHVQKQVQPLADEMHSIQRSQEASIADLRTQLAIQQRDADIEPRRARY